MFSEEETLAVFALLRKGLGIEAGKGGTVVLDEKQWGQLFNLSQQHGVTAIMFDGIMQLDEDNRPPRKIKIAWSAEQYKVEEDYGRKSRVEQKLLRFFEQNNIPTLVLKGSALSALYPTPSHRTSADIDLYHYDKQPQADNLVKTKLGLPVSNEAHHHTKYTFDGVTVESHYDFVNQYIPHSNRKYESMLKTLAPTPTFEALFLLRHMAGHFASSRITLKNLCDWALFVEKHRADVDWNTVGKATVQYDMQHFVGALMHILEKHLHIESPDGINYDVDRDISQRVLNDILDNEFGEADPKDVSLKRLVWKIRRFRANRWKIPLCYSESPFQYGCQSIFGHLLKPHSILKKM